MFEQYFFRQEGSRSKVYGGLLATGHRRAGHFFFFFFFFLKPPVCFVRRTGGTKTITLYLINSILHFSGAVPVVYLTIFNLCLFPWRFIKQTQHTPS